MAPFVHSVEIERSPEDVFAFSSDVSRFPEWQEGVESSQVEGGGPVERGARISMRRRVGPSVRAVTIEMTEHDPPRSFAFRGLDGPIRPLGRGTIEPLENGQRSRLTFELDVKGHGIGVLLVPFVRRQVREEVPKSYGNLKRLLESDTGDTGSTDSDAGLGGTEGSSGN
jgi:uncharacterized protein YndB with AHSA1/START domain